MRNTGNSIEGIKMASYDDLDEEVGMSESSVNESDVKSRQFRSGSSIENDTETIIRQFRVKRELQKEKSFWFVVKLSWALMLTGMVGFVTDSALLYLAAPHYPTFLSSIMSSLSMFIVGCGYLLFSTVPLDLLDVDKTVRKKYWMRLLFVLVGFLISVLFTMVPPFVHGISSLIAISCLYPDDSTSPYWNHFSFKVCIWFLSYSACMGIVYCYWCYVSYYNIDMNEQGVVNLNVPIGEGYFSMYVVLSFYYCLAAVLFARVFYNRRKLYYTSNHERGAGPTMGIYLCMLVWNFLFGVGLFINGIWLYVHYVGKGSDDKDLLYFSTACIGVGVALLVPPVVVYSFGRETIFNVMAKRYDNDSNNMQRDGAFIAGLLDRVDVVIGQSWYVHRDEPDTTYGEFDHNRYWVKGRVTEFSDDNKMAVSLTHDHPNPQPHVWLSLGTTTDSDALLQFAKDNLRCVDFETIMTKKLLSNGSVRDTGVESFFDLGRSVAKGEKIDFFISHSWHDAAETKLDKLNAFGERFRKKYGRYPTFWLDKVCINQNNIGSGLKVLPINVMGCRKMLVLCGDTYSSRLWCVWEICTLFSFVDIESAFDKVVVLPLDTESGNESMKKTVMEELVNFHISNARCYDPNEEVKLNKVIDAVGVEKFHDKIRKLASFYVGEGRGRSVTL